MGRINGRILQFLWDVPLHFKIIGMVVGLIIFLGTTLTLCARQRMMEFCVLQLKQQGLSLAHDLAARSADGLLTNAFFELHQLVNDTKANNSGVQYVFITDAAGEVVAHTFAKAVPAGLFMLPRSESGSISSIRTFESEGGRIHDITVPVVEGQAGAVHLGMGEASLQRAVTRITTLLLLATAIASLVGLGAACLLTHLLTKPVFDLVQVAEVVGQGDLTQRATVWASDEIGRLSRAFNQMISVLEQSHGELLRRNEDLFRMGQELQEKRDMLARLLDKAITAQEEERRRIALELHDDAGQALTSLVIGLKVAEARERIASQKELLSSLRSTASQVLQNIHDLAVKLRLSVLDGQPLVAGLEHYLREYARQTDIQVDFHATLSAGERLPRECERTIFRIVQEALSNAAKHAKCRRVSVLLEEKAGEISAIVEDDGIGFDVQQWRKSSCMDHLGLFGMWERASLAGGALLIESEPESGTTVFIRIPKCQGEP